MRVGLDEREIVLLAKLLDLAGGFGELPVMWWKAGGDVRDIALVALREMV